MKVLLDIKDSKVSFIMELLNSFSFVKTQPLSDGKAELITDLREAVQELNKVKKGEVQARNVEDLMNYSVKTISKFDKNLKKFFWF